MLDVKAGDTVILHCADGPVQDWAQHNQQVTNIHRASLQ